MIPRRVADRLSYANVIATLALFISLGGVSYAVVSLPAHSVGARQLKPRSVTPNALSFPVGAYSFTSSAEVDLPHRACPEGPPKACRVRLREGLPLGQVHLTKPGKLVLTAIAALEDEGRPGTQ